MRGTFAFAGKNSCESSSNSKRGRCVGESTNPSFLPCDIDREASTSTASMSTDPTSSRPDEAFDSIDRSSWVELQIRQIVYCDLKLNSNY